LTASHPTEKKALFPGSVLSKPIIIGMLKESSNDSFMIEELKESSNHSYMIEVLEAVSYLSS
jgi:hypothetical protein